MMQLQQGDVQIEQVDDVPESAKEVTPNEGPIVLAEGEATGHAHRITEADGVRLYEDDSGTLWVEANETKTLTHEEHDPIEVPAGVSKVTPTYEVDPLSKMEREVID